MKTSTSELTPTIEEYRQKGYTILRGVFSSEEVAAMQAECTRLLELPLVDPDNLRTPFGDLPDGSSIVERYDPVIDVSPLFAAIVADERILAPLRAIFEDDALLFKDKIIFKLPGMSGYKMHQDQAYWQICPADDILSVSVQIDGAAAQNGAIELFSGYQHELMTPEGEIRGLNESEKAQIDASRGQRMDTQAGDILIFHSLTPHQSGPNTAEVSRRSLYLSYSAARSGDLYEIQQKHMAGYRSRKASEEQRQKRFFR